VHRVFLHDNGYREACLFKAFSSRHQLIQHFLALVQPKWRVKASNRAFPSTGWKAAPVFQRCQHGQIRAVR